MTTGAVTLYPANQDVWPERDKYEPSVREQTQAEEAPQTAAVLPGWAE